MTNVKNAKRYNDNMFKIFDDAKRLNENNDFIRFLEANMHLTLDNAIKTFKALENVPY